MTSFFPSTNAIVCVASFFKQKSVSDLPIECLILSFLRGYSIQTFFFVFAALNTNLFLRTRGPKVLQDEEIDGVSDANVLRQFILKFIYFSTLVSKRRSQLEVVFSWSGRLNELNGNQK